MENKNCRKKRKIRFFLPWQTALFFLLLLFTEGGRLFPITLLAASLHELGHLLLIRFCGGRAESITLYPCGAEIRLCSALLSYGRDIAVALGGPAINLLCFFLFLPVGGSGAALWRGCHLTLCVTNLFPVTGLDGGTVLQALLCLVTNDKTADRICRICSFSGLLLLWVGAVYILLADNGSPSLFVISVTLFFSLFLRGKG